MLLNDSEVAQIRRAGEHFKKVLRELFDTLPRSACSIAGLARWSGVNKSTCQRLVQALTKTNDGVDVIVTLPGSSALQQVSEQFKHLLEPSDVLPEFDRMIEQYEELILKYASSQAELKRFLVKYQSKETLSLQSYNRTLKKSAYDANKEITGESVDSYIGIHFIRQNRKDKQQLDEMIVACKLGVELSTSARPFVQSFDGNFTEIEINAPLSLSQQNRNSFNNQQSGEYLLAEYSTPGVENCYAGVGNLKNALIYNHTLHQFDRQKFDITLAYLNVKTQANPLFDDYKIVCQGEMQRSPAKRLLLMTFIEKELDLSSSVQGGCYPSSIKMHQQGHRPEDLWSERFSDSPEIKLISPEERLLSLKLKVDPLDSMIADSFSLLGEQRDNFAGYYMDVDYPLWLTSHRIYFVFK